MGLLTLVSPSSTWESTTPQAEKLAHAGIEARPKRSMFNTRVPVLARFGIGRLSSTSLVCEALRRRSPPLPGAQPSRVG
jgi:hypothetical protein